MAFDTRRRVTWMFGGAPFGSAGNELWTYDAAANVWRQVARTSPWPAERRFGSMAYDSRRDVFLLWGGVTASDNVFVDTWIFEPSTEKWQRLDPTAFRAPGPGEFGTLERNSLVGPARFNIDMGVVRSLPLGGERRLQFRAEAFNVLNTLQHNDPVSVLNNGNFGLITSAADARVIQLALKYTF